MLHYTNLSLRPFAQAAQPNRRYELHKLVAKAFAYRDATPETNRVLYRVDPQSPLRVLVKSQIPVSPGLLENPAVAAYESKSANIVLRPHTAYQFLLVGNPTHRVSRKVAPITDPGEALDWLNRKLEPGFTVLASEITRSQELKVTKPGNSIVLTETTFMGLLRVTNSQAALEIVTTGVGRSKAWGCGLLSLALAH